MTLSAGSPTISVEVVDGRRGARAHNPRVSRRSAARVKAVTLTAIARAQSRERPRPSHPTRHHARFRRLVSAPRLRQAFGSSAPVTRRCHFARCSSLSSTTTLLPSPACSTRISAASARRSSYDSAAPRPTTPRPCARCVSATACSYSTAHRTVPAITASKSVRIASTAPGSTTPRVATIATPCPSSRACVSC